MGALASYLYSIPIIVKIWGLWKLYVAHKMRIWGKLHILGLLIVSLIEITVFYYRTFLEFLYKIRHCVCTSLTRFPHWIVNFIVQRWCFNFIACPIIFWKLNWITQMLEIMMLNIWFIIIIKFNWFFNNWNFFFNLNNAYSWGNF
jgi:hypothetical protein